MVVLKHNGLVYIAVSQMYQKDFDAIRTGKVNPENLKAYHPKRRKNQIIASNGVTSETEALRYENIFPTDSFNMKTLVLGVFPALCHMSKYFGRGDGQRSAADMVFAQDSEAYVLYKEGVCLKIEDVFACGVNSDVAISLYDAEKIEDPNDYFKKVFIALEELYGEVMFPVAVLNTGSNKISVINTQRGTRR